jgi:hypothetical protein
VGERREMPAWTLLSVVRVVLACCSSWEAKNWLKVGSEGVPLPGHFVLSIPVYKRQTRKMLESGERMKGRFLLAYADLIEATSSLLELW